MDGAEGRPFREWCVDSLGIDLLAGRFLAGTPRSLTHLVWFLIQGRVIFCSGDVRQPVMPGQFVVSPAGQPHWIEVSSSRSKTTGVWFHFKDEPRWAALHQHAPCTRNSSEGENLFHLMKRFLIEKERNEARSIPLALCYAESVRLILERELHLDSADVAYQWREKLEGLWKEVDAEPRSNWTVEQLASRLRLSPGYFHHLCRSQHGIGPMQMVRSLRINVAMTLLRSTRLPLDAIAEAVGYSSSYAFSKAFLVHTGIRPGAFRSSEGRVMC